MTIISGYVFVVSVWQPVEQNRDSEQISEARVNVTPTDQVVYILSISSLSHSNKCGCSKIIEGNIGVLCG